MDQSCVESESSTLELEDKTESQVYTSEITDDVLPSTFKNVIISHKQNHVVIRSNLSGIEDIAKWISEFSANTSSRWSVRNSNISGPKMVCAKKYMCHRSGYRSSDAIPKENTRSKYTGCKASITCKIKLTTCHTKKRDIYIRRGLPAIIQIRVNHNHPLKTHHDMKCLLWNDEVRNKFIKYFNDGVLPADASRLYRSELAISETNSGTATNELLEPPKRTIGYWFQEWRLLQDDLQNPPALEVKKAFEEYFSLGIDPVEARRVYRKKLIDSGIPAETLNIPRARLIFHWYNEWKSENGENFTSTYNKIRQMFKEYFNQKLRWKKAMDLFEKEKESLNIVDVAVSSTCSIWNPSEKIVKFWYHEWQLEQELNTPKKTRCEPEELKPVIRISCSDDIEDIHIPVMQRSEITPQISEILKNLNDQFGDEEDAPVYERILNKLLGISSREEWKQFLNSVDGSLEIQNNNGLNFVEVKPLNIIPQMKSETFNLVGLNLLDGKTYNLVRLSAPVLNTL